MSHRELDELLAAAGARMTPEEGCPEPGRFVELYAGRLAAAEAEALREHLARCPTCVDEALAAQRFVAALAAPVPGAEASVRRGPWRRPAALWLELAAVLAVTLGVALVIQRATDAPPAVAWPVSKAAWQPAPRVEEPLYRDAEASDPEVEASFEAAMSRYVADDYAGAASALARHLDAHPQDQRARFYRGVALLLVGRDREAQEELARVEAMASPALADDARWYRALALGRAGDSAKAASELAVLAAGTGSRRAAAQRLLAELAPAGRP
jgi:tetratricopeptide (TPR) repeat protein